MIEYCQNCEHSKSLHFDPFEGTVAPCSGEINLIGPDDAQLCGCKSLTRGSILNRFKHFIRDWAGRIVKAREEPVLGAQAPTKGTVKAPRESFSLRAKLVKLQTELERDSFRSANPLLHLAAMKIGELLNRT
jgi:hypothetical protein